MAPLEVDDKEIDDLLSKASVWLGKATQMFDCKHAVDVTSVKCKQSLKDDLAVLVSEAFHMVRFQNDRLRQMKSALSTTKTDLISHQKSVIDLQEKLIESKDQQLQAVQTAVTSSVADTVKEELKSYSAAVQGNVSQTLTTETLKRVVKTAVQEEDRGKNLMVFGLPEKENENLSECVGELFEEIGHKPSMELCRVGMSSKGKATRPVKVILSRSSTANEILAQVRKLRQTEKFKSVFVCPDRSIEERASQRLLVQELNRRMKAEPGKRHFIRGGNVHSEDKSVK